MKFNPHNQQGRKFLLDYGDISGIKKSKAHVNALLQFHWEYYSELAYQRSKIYDLLQKALQETAIRPYVFDQWHRAVRFRYSTDPLSVQGSLTGVGGRFNIGNIDHARFPPFPALYLAKDSQTAEDELLGRNEKKECLSSDQLALADSSRTIVLLQGQLESVLNLYEPICLEPFMKLIGEFHISDKLIVAAKKLGEPKPGVVKSVKQLMERVLDANWRFMPMQLDIPAASQILGQIAAEAGIEGILYPSVITRQPCLAVYPQNFANSSSYVELHDEAPSTVLNKRVDKTYKK